MLSSDSISKINQALANSFANIKRDMEEIKEAIRSHNKDIITLRSDVSNLRTEAVTKEKIDFIRLKVGELNENLKKVWDIEKGLRGVAERSVNKVEFEQVLDEIKSKIGQLNFKINELNKNYVAESQIKDVIANINQEFINVREAIKEARAVKAGISMEDLEHHTSKIAKKVENFEKNLTKLKQDAKDFVSESQVRYILDDANKELDGIRRDLAILEKRTHLLAPEAKVMALVESLKKQIEKVDERSHGYVTENEVSQVVDDINKGFLNVREKIKALEKENKQHVKQDEVKAVIDDVNKEFLNFKRELMKIRDKSREYVDVFKLNGAVEKLQKEIDGIKKETKNFVSELQVKSLVNDINKELAAFKDELDYVAELELDMKAIDRTYSKKTDTEKLAEQLNEVRREYTKKNDTEKLAAHIEQIEETMKRITSTFAENKKVDKIEKALEEVKNEIKKLRSEFVSRKEYDADMHSLDNELNDINGRTIIKHLKPAKTIKNLKKKQKYGKTMFFANFIIFISFLLLAFSVMSYVVGEISLMEKAAIGAVVLFIVGIIIRSKIISKRKSL